MKTKLLAGLLTASLAFTVIPNGIHTVQAAEIDAYSFRASAINQNEQYEISVGDNLYEYGWLFDADNEYVDSDKWDLVQADWFEKNDVHRFYYSDLPYIEDSDSDFVVPFDNTVPEAAFGKYVHVYCGGFLLSDTDNALWTYAPSKYYVTKWDSSKSYTVNDNGDDKSVTVFTIQNSKKSGKKINIQSSIKVNGKKYKITGIGDYALNNSEGTGLTTVTLPSTITSIGKEAFKDAKNLKTITINGNVKSIGKNAFSGINKKAVFKIKATKANYKKIVSKIKKAGAPKTVTYKNIK